MKQLHQWFQMRMLREMGKAIIQNKCCMPESNGLYGDILPIVFITMKEKKVFPFVCYPSWLVIFSLAQLCSQN